VSAVQKLLTTLMEKLECDSGVLLHQEESQAGQGVVLTTVVAKSSSNSGGSPPLSLLTAAELSGLRWACSAHHLPIPTKLVLLTTQANLPFQLFPGLTKGLVTVAELMEEVDFCADDVVTASGRVVQERRLTAWQTRQENSSSPFATTVDASDAATADPSSSSSSSSSSSTTAAAAAGFATTTGFAYSGKVMPAKPFSPSVARACAAVSELTGTEYDGCLVNLYLNGDSGMRYHSDPDQVVCLLSLTPYERWEGG
jgi:hypothetical protein